MLHNSGRYGWDGFTLIEVLVMLLLVSLLAAAVFPVVTQRVSRGEPVRAADDLGRIREALEAFGHDVRSGYSSDLEDLATPIGTSDLAIRRSGEGAPFSGADSAGWNGPYIDASLRDGAVVTGFGVPIRDDFTRFDATSSAPSGGHEFRSSDTSLFVAVQIGTAGRQLTAAQFEAINDLVDGREEPDGPGPNTSWTEGRMRFDNSLVPADSIAYYLAVPIEG